MGLVSLIGALKAIVAVVLVFLGTIVIHEFGHFIVAKWSGVAVPTFAVGFGPKLVKWFRHGTEYSIRPYLFGGFVQLAGEVPQDSLFKKGEQIAVVVNGNDRIIQVGEPDDVRDGDVYRLVDLDLTDKLTMTLEADGVVRTYRVMPHARLMTSAKNSMPIVERHEQVLGKPLWQRASIILAGPVMNFLLAGVLFSVVYMHTGVPLNQPVLGQIEAGSPAQAAGLTIGDRVLSVDGKSVSDWMNFVVAIQQDKSNPPAPLDLRIERAGQVRNIEVTPRMVDISGQHVPQLGIHQPVSYSVAQTVPSGFTSVYYGTSQTLGYLVNHVIAQHQFQNLSGPVGIADVIGQQAQAGVWNVLMIAGLLSLNLGLMNLLPIPALDGGRLLFMIVELFRGKAIDPRKEGIVHIVGFALLMLFGVMITYRDVLRLF
ncbi:RIP metalloprotease RseP [Alicyclobacillus mengziensis]|uniref:Zinc metalloprotease n=1 Tax=Alicyclobacillus mengziensis TaxID=2931921 RepID=A0A9X7VUG4_9BACL|nr:RIP metalloprotease RseP [Alicyclobacillus mengziensis]QSO45371.1 RIP metalloprotease RseP [Alicyclobacillus mengziensis]